MGEDVLFNIKMLAESLFSVGLDSTPDRPEFALDGDIMSNLIKKGEIKREQLSKFLSSLGKTAESANHTIEEHTFYFVSLVIIT